MSFATNSFTFDECTLLANLLASKYGFVTSVVSGGNIKDQWRISVWRRSMPAFADIVRPHIHPSIIYKLGEFA